MAAIRPMKAVAGRLPVGDGWAYEIKWDGMRAIAAYDDAGVRAHSSRLNDITARFPELELLHDSLAVDVVLDGELVALGADGLPSFSPSSMNSILSSSGTMEKRKKNDSMILFSNYSNSLLI